MKKIEKAFIVFALVFCFLTLPISITTKAYAAQKADMPLISSNVVLARSEQTLRIKARPKFKSGQKQIKIAKRRRRSERRYRRYKRRRKYRNVQRDIAIGVGIAILGIIAEEAARGNYENAMRRCARDYRSFEWETGTYITYGGRVRLCPYLVPYVR